MTTFFSERLYFINSSPEVLKQVLQGQKALGDFLNIQVPDQWTEFGNAPFQYALDQIKDHPEEAIWWSWLPIHKSDNTLIGNCGYKGPPVEGCVEIGYEVALAYRGQKLATEIARALIKNAATFPEVRIVLAHTLAEENASTSILKKNGFSFIREVDDPDDGLIWRWELKI